MNVNDTSTAQPFVRRTRKVFYHPNGKGTGSALQLELHPAHEDTEGSVFLTMAPQRTIGIRTADDTVHPTFDWRNAVCLKLDLMDLAQILQDTVSKVRAVLLRPGPQSANSATTA